MPFFRFSESFSELRSLAPVDYEVNVYEPDK